MKVLAVFQQHLNFLNKWSKELKNPRNKSQGASPELQVPYAYYYFHLYYIQKNIKID